MSDCIISGIEAAESGWQSEGAWLLLLHPEQKPPHLGIIAFDRYYSLTNKGLELGEPASKLMAAITRKQIPVLALKLAIPEGVDANQSLDQAFAAYEKASNGITCLYPIRDWVEAVWNLNVQQAGYIFELVPILLEHSIVAKALQLHLGPWMNDGRYTLLRYTRDEILQRIETLNRSQVTC